MAARPGVLGAPIRLTYPSRTSTATACTGAGRGRAAPAPHGRPGACAPVEHALRAMFLSDGEYNAFARVLQGKDLYPCIKDEGPYDLGLDWVTGNGPREREYSRRRDDRGDPVQREHAAAASGHPHRVARTGQDRRHRQLLDLRRRPGKKLVLTYVPAIVTADDDHLGEAFVGSYSLGYRVQGQDPDGTLVVEYTLDNSTSNESFLHYVGYYDWLENFNRDEGALSTVGQEIKWRPNASRQVIGSCPTDRLVSSQS